MPVKRPNNVFEIGWEINLGQTKKLHPHFVSSETRLSNGYRTRNSLYPPTQTQESKEFNKFKIFRKVSLTGVLTTHIYIQ